MASRGPTRILFLSTGNCSLGRFAELLLATVAGRMGLACVTSSRQLVLDEPADGRTMHPAAIEILGSSGYRVTKEEQRPPMPMTAEDLEQAGLIVLLGTIEQADRLREQAPHMAGRLEPWQVADGPETLPLIEREVMSLTARFLGGPPRARDLREPLQGELCPGCRQLTDACTCPPKKEAVASAPDRSKVVRVGRETKGRRGKGVTVVSDLPLDAEGLQELAAALKQRCGTGGTVKDGRIEIQGDLRDRVITELERLGYRVKRSGG